MDEHIPAPIGWYGKLPSRGDFVGRGLPRAWLRTWDDWLQRGLAGAALRCGTALHDRLLTMVPWQCVVLPIQPGRPAWCGVIAPSTDRVGRSFPVLLAEACNMVVLDDVALSQLQARGQSMARWLRLGCTLSSLKEFDGGATQLLANPWPCPRRATEVSEDRLGDLRTKWPAAGSFWWRVDPASDMRTPLAEAWPPREALMLELLGEPN